MVDNHALRCELCPIQNTCSVVIKPYTEICVCLLQKEIREWIEANTREFKLPESWAAE